MYNSKYTIFTPIESSLGALLIQAATTSYMHFEGKAIGFSSILYNSIFKPSTHSVSIVVGLFLSSAFIKTVLPSFSPVVNSGLTYKNTFFGSSLSYLLAGCLVGIGSSAGCGCTSGHMLIGLSRLRWRSFIATCTFFVSAVITTMVTGNYNKINNGNSTPNYFIDSNFTIFKENIIPLLALTIIGETWSYFILPKVGKILEKKNNKKLLRFITGISSGFLFGCGLFISGMTDTSKIIGFLSFLTPNNFDPSLALIPLFAIIPNIVIWKQWIPQSKEEAVGDKKGVVIKKPLFEEYYDLNFSNATDPKFLLGNVLFGVGWGLAGVCPGPGILTMFTELINGVVGNGVLYMAGFVAGAYAEKLRPCTGGGAGDN